MQNDAECLNFTNFQSWRNSKQEVPRDGQDAAKFWQNAIILSEHCQKFIQQLSKWWRKECQALQFFSDAILRKSCRSQKMLQSIFEYSMKFV